MWKVKFEIFCSYNIQCIGFWILDIKYFKNLNVMVWYCDTINIKNKIDKNE